MRKDSLKLKTHSVGKESSQSGYIWISCSPSAENNSMVVEMSYKGDLALVSYLLASAQQVVDEEIR